MSKISELSDGGVIQGGDTLIAVRSGGNVKVTYGGSTTANIDGGTIDGTVIGGTTAAAITGTTITGTSFVSSGDMTFGDSDKAIFGTSGDLQIYHDGSNSYIKDLGTGDLFLSGNTGVQIQSDAGENMITTAANGAVSLFYDASAKLATTATGIDVTGTVTADGLTVDGTAIVSDSTASVLRLLNTGTTGDGLIHFGDSDSNFSGVIQYNHDADYMALFTATQERLRIDSSGNLLVGKTTTDFGTQGIRLEGSNGKIEITRNNNLPFAINRLTSDGDLAQFYKDGTTVGSIGTNGGDLYFADSSYGGIKPLGDGYAIVPCASSGADYDNAMQLGASGTRFKDLYLSGGVYLGGTGAANHLDDYEEGTWTPVLSDGTNNATASTAVGTYTKIGRMVHVKGTLIISSLGSVAGSLLFITGLPFTTNGTANTSASANFGYGQGLNLPVGTSLAGYLNTGNTRIVVQSWDAVAGTTNTTPAEWSADGGAYFDATYYI